MSKLDDLINELCPNGVKYVDFLTVCNYIRGITYNKSDEINNGTEGIGVFRANNITLDSNTLNFDDVKVVSKDVRVKESQWLKKGDILICAGSGSKEHIGKVAFIFNDLNYTFGGFMGVIRPKQGNINPNFLFHIMTSQMFKAHLAKASGAASSTINNINNDTWKGFHIPVPLLEIQCEIVRILDNFTDLTADLTAELTARKKQYEYYRDSLLSFKDEVEWKTLGEYCKFIRGPFGGSLKKECFVSEGYAVYEQQHAIYGKLNFRYYIDEKKFNELKRFEVSKNDLIVSCSGTIGKVMIIPENAPKGIINQALLKLTPNENILPKYLKYFFESTITNELNDSARGGAIQNVPSVGELKSIKIQVPPLEIQERIVKVLDNFDAICSDLKIGLPAEIEARKKQYEYYRDKLLAFKRSENR